VISGCVSGAADCSGLVGCDVVPGASRGRIASIFRVKDSCWTVLNMCHTVRVSR
jgi:hypothetical protein